MSQVSICNQALTSLGAAPIINIDADTTESKLCKLHYDLVLHSLLEAASWSFATKRMELPRSAETVSAPFTNKFLVPVSVVRVLEAGENPDFQEVNGTYWQIEEGFILSNTESMFVRVIVNNITTASFSASFTRAFVAMLAAAMALAITQSQSTEQAKLREAGQLIQIATTLDSTQGRTRKVRSSKYLSVRNRSGGNYFQSYTQG